MAKVVLRAPKSILRQPKKPTVRIAGPSLSAFAQAPDPLDPDNYPEAIEASTTEELKQLRQGFIDRMEKERERVRNATDAGYYFVAVFEVHDQVSAFLSAIGIRGDTLFVDGRLLAKAMGVEIPAFDVIYNPGGPSSWAKLVRKPKRRR